MLPSYNNNNQNFNAFSNNLSIYNNTSAQQNNNTYNINVPYNYNQQRVVNPNPNQGAHYYSNMDNPLNNKRFTHQQYQAVNTNGIIPIVGSINNKRNNNLAEHNYHQNDWQKHQPKARQKADYPEESHDSKEESEGPSRSPAAKKQ